MSVLVVQLSVYSYTRMCLCMREITHPIDTPLAPCMVFVASFTECTCEGWEGAVHMAWGLTLTHDDFKTDINDSYNMPLALLPCLTQCLQMQPLH